MASKDKQSITDALSQDTFQSTDDFQLVQEDLRTAEKERLQTGQRRKEMLESLRRSAKKNRSLSDETDARRKEMLRLLREGGVANVETVVSRLKRELAIIQSKGMLSSASGEAAQKLFKNTSLYLERFRALNQVEKKTEGLRQHGGMGGETPDPAASEREEKIAAAIPKMRALSEALRSECDRLQEKLCSSYDMLEELILQDALEDERIRDFFNEGISALNENEQNKIIARCRQLCRGASAEKRRTIYRQVIERLASIDQRVATQIHRVCRRKSRDALKEGRYEQASRELKYAIQLWPDELSTHRMLASICFRKRDDEGALASLSEAMRLAPDDALLVKRVASLCDKMGRLDDAITYYKKALELSQNKDVTLFRELGRLTLDAKQYQEAVRYLEEFIGNFPEDAECLKWLGMAYFNMGKPDYALSYLRAALKASPESLEIVQRLALAYRKLSLYDEAVELLKSRLETARPSISLSILLGSTYQDNGEWEKAEQLYMRILEKNPSSASLLQALADVRMANGRVEEALEAYESAINNDSRKPALYVEMSRAYRKLGRIEQAEQLLTQSLDSLNGDVEIRQELAAVFTELGRWDDAASLLRDLHAEPRSA